MPEGLDRYARLDLADLEPLDVTAVARRVRRRGRTRRGALVGALAVAALAVGAYAVIPADGEDSQEVITGPDDPAGFVLEGPSVGTWSQAADPPFPARLDLEPIALDDGRILFFGGVPYMEQQNPGAPPVWFPDGGIYDPSANAWEELPPMPLPDDVTIIGPSGGVVFTSVQVVDDQLAVVANGTGNVVAAGIYDLGGGTWETAPPLLDVDGYADAVGTDGETIALVRTSETSADGTPLDRPGPWTLRWSPGEPGWSEGAPPELVPRSDPGTASRAGMTAVWGGSTLGGGVPLADATPLDDGAIYDVSADRWSAIPPTASIPGLIDAMVVWEGDTELIVGQGFYSNPPPDGAAGAVAAFDVASQRWRDLPAPPPIRTPSLDDVQPSGPATMSGGLSLIPSDAVIAMGQTGGTDAHGWYLDTDAWRRAPHPGVATGTDLVVSYDKENPDAFRMAVRDGADRWRPTEPPDDLGQPLVGGLGQGSVVLLSHDGGVLHAWLLTTDP